MAETRKRRRLSSSGAFKEEQGVAASELQESEAAANADLPANSEGQRRTLFVRSLPPTATTESLTEYFSQSYPLKHATVIVDPSTKQSKGYGFVTFADTEDAQQALAELNGSLFDGRHIKIDVAEPRKRDVDEKEGKSVPSRISKEKEERERQRQDTRPPKLIVRNLPWSISEPEHLGLLFRSYGKVKHAVIPKKGSRLAGFGFVVIRGRKNAEKAMEGVNGKEVEGRTLAVDWAVEKEVWEEAQQPPTGETGEKEKDKEKQDEDEGGVSLGTNEDEDDADEGEDGDEDGDDDLSMPDASEESELEDEGDEDEDEDDAEDERNASTVFIRNLPFTATDGSLYDHFTQFGRIRYARVVFDHETDRPRGTAFVCFGKAEDATSCVREAPRHVEQQPPAKSATGFKHSVLEDQNKDPSGRYTMDGRVLQISYAVTKKEANRLTTEGTLRREVRDKDKRQLFLLSEGTVPSNSPLYSKLSATEVKMREASTKQRQKLVKTNPTLHISLTRLSIRNLPRSIDSKALKALAREAVVGFAKDVKQGLREPLSKEELTRSADAMKEAEKERKTKGKGIVKQAKVVFEGREGGKVAEKGGAGRSRGYGFIEYTSHRSALMGLRWLNGHAVKSAPSSEEDMDPEDKKKRLVVEFAMENAQVVKRRQENEAKWSRKDGPPAAGGQDTRAVKGNNSKSNAGGAKGWPKRKRSNDKGDVKGSNAKAPAESGESTADKDNQVAKRNRIIARKRMTRRARKGN